MKNEVRRLREAKGLTQRQLAQMAGTSQQQIQRIEAGVQSTKFDVVVKICAALDAPTEVVFPAKTKTNTEKTMQQHTGLLGSSSYAWIRQHATDEALTGVERTRAEMVVLMKDPFAVELARRLVIASLMLQMGESFSSLYRSYGRYLPTEYDPGQAITPIWMVVMIAMEDKVYGQGRPGSIINHPVLDSFPALRDIAKNRRDRLVGPTARRMEAAFRTLTNFDPKKPPTQGVSSFDRVLGGIDEAEDLWVVMAGLNLRLQIEAHKNSPNPPAIQ